MALAARASPIMLDNLLRYLRNKSASESSESKPLDHRRWRLLQLESSISCNLRCIMCPWVTVRDQIENQGNMSLDVWNGLVPHLNEVRSIDFTGGGEPLLQPHLLDWISQAKKAGCEAGFLTNGMLLREQLSELLLDMGLNWIGFSIDGADRETYERIRRGAQFERLCSNIKILTDKRINLLPLVMINFVVMRSNCQQLEMIIDLAHELGVDQVNFKQCDVIRGDHGKGHGLFESQESKQIKQLQKALAKASRRARKLNIKTTAFSFVPDEQPVCDQDPRDSLFVRYDGTVSPCINLAIGGPSSFLGEDIVFPHVAYGRLPDDELPDIWEGETARLYRGSFSQRVKTHDAALAAADLGRDIIKLKEAFKEAVEAMPPAPGGCRKCHYLYDI